MPAYALPPVAPGAEPGGGGYGNQPVVYTIPSVGFGGPARVGAAVTGAFMLLPCVLFAFVGSWLLHQIRETMDIWLRGSVRLPVQFVSVDLPLNFIDLLGMREVYDKVTYWDDRLWLVFFALWLVPWFTWIISGSLFAVLLAAIYNMVGKAGGGIRMTMTPANAASFSRPAGPPVGPQSLPAWAPNPPPGSATAWPGQDWPRETRR